jgi:hypothetical protein
MEKEFFGDTPNPGREAAPPAPLLNSYLLLAILSSSPCVQGINLRSPGEAGMFNRGDHYANESATRNYG